MAIRGAKRRRAADRGFVLSDHADWDGLISAIDATGCESVYLTHGYTATFTRYLNEIGYEAHEVHTLYGDDEEAAPTEPILDESKASMEPTPAGIKAPSKSPPVGETLKNESSTEKLDSNFNNEAIINEKFIGGSERFKKDAKKVSRTEGDLEGATGGPTP
jgi:hypothetical protein